MLLDLLSPSNQVSFNIKLAHIIGLNEAVYISELVNIFDKAVRKNATTEYNGHEYFTLCRAYMEHRTTLSESAQHDIEMSLSKIELIYVIQDQPDVISINLDALASIVGGAIDGKYIDRISSIVKQPKTKEEKNNAKINGARAWMRKCIQTENPELQLAYYNWIDSALMRYGLKLTKAAIYQAQADVDAFSNHNLDIALYIVTKSAIKGYDDMKWVIEEYKSLHPNYKPDNHLEVAQQRDLVLDGEEF